MGITVVEYMQLCSIHNYYNTYMSNHTGNLSFHILHLLKHYTHFFKHKYSHLYTMSTTGYKMVAYHKYMFFSYFIFYFSFYKVRYSIGKIRKVHSTTMLVCFKSAALYIKILRVDIHLPLCQTYCSGRQRLTFSYHHLKQNKLLLTREQTGYQSLHFFENI